jgi:hypothetical protein
MRAVLLLTALLAVGCRIDLDHREDDANTSGRTCKVATTATCVEGATMNKSDFTWIKTKIFAANCFGASCHSGVTASGNLDLIDDPYTTLMGATGAGTMSNGDPTKKRVVAGDPAQSYLFFMIHGLDGKPHDFTDPLKTVGFMPMSNATLCCQKIDAIERWIMAGAMNN